MRKAVKCVYTVLLLCGAVLFVSADSEAAASPKLNTSSVKLKISVYNGGNTYGYKKIKIKNKKSFKIKKLIFRSTNDRVATVSGRGDLYAASVGKTKIIVNVKYQKKNAKNSKIIKKKLTVPVTVSPKYMGEAPETGMQYDETGKAEPVYPFTPQYDNVGCYSNETSFIDRFPVYVETDYDTDQDGKRDLVMAYVQVPRSATLGYYKAPVIMHADPYLVNNHRPGYEYVEMMENMKNNAFDYNLLMSSPEPRTPVSETSTAETVKDASDWVNGMRDEGYNEEHLDDNQYFLIRGFAYVVSPGLGGSKECEGLQCCGELVEAKAYAAIIEWLHGDRNGYADKAGTKLLRADWCNGHTAVSNLSYLGTLAYEVSTLGVKGLDTVIPCGAIASWYDYVNVQGVIDVVCSNYMSFLGDYCAKRYYYASEKEKKRDPAFQVYRNYLLQKSYDEVMAGGVYGDYWSRFDFSNAKPTVPALVVEVLNDRIVKTKQTMLMRKAFKDAGCTCKVLFHQGYHDMLSYPSSVLKVGDEYYDDLINRWLAHYMAGVDNGIDQMKDFTVQSNVDDSWTAYDEGMETETMKLDPDEKDKESTVHFDINKITEIREADPANKNTQINTEGMHAVWTKDIDKDTTLNGIGVVHLRVKMPDTHKNSPALTVRLMDTSDKEFYVRAEDTDSSPGSAKKILLEDKPVYDGEGVKQRFEMVFGKKKSKEFMIREGMINLAMPSAGWEHDTCKAPSEPVKDDTYYDYTVYLNPMNYTVKKGHKLKLYIIGVSIEEDLSGFKFVDEYSEPVPYYFTVPSKYDFTVDNTVSYAELPIVKE